MTTYQSRLWASLYFSDDSKGVFKQNIGVVSVLTNQIYSEITRYMDTVLAPFLDTYHRNIQNSYQQLTGKILRRIKDEINAAVQKKLEIYAELTELADKLKIPCKY